MKKAELSSDSEYEEEKFAQHTKASVAVIEDKNEQREKISAVMNKSSVKERENPKLIWNLDSGASDLMTPYKDILMDFDNSITGNVRWATERNPLS